MNPRTSHPSSLSPVQDFHFDKDTETLFSRFQTGVSILKDDPKLFKGAFYIAIKDVDSADVDDLTEEFEAKIGSICERNSDNFFLRMYSGRVHVATMPPFQRPDYNHSLHDLGECLQLVPHVFDSGRLFLRDLKLLIAQISTRDWAPIDGKRISMRVNLLRQHLQAAVAVGRMDEGLVQEGEGEGKGTDGCALRCFDSGEAIADCLTVQLEGRGEGSENGGADECADEQGGERVGQEAAPTSTDVQLEAVEERDEDGLLAVGKKPCPHGKTGSCSRHSGSKKPPAAEFSLTDDGLDLVTTQGGKPVHELLSALQRQFEAVVHRSGADDASWHAGFDAFLQLLLSRRRERVLTWLEVNTAEYSGDGNVQKLKADASDMLLQASQALSLCSSQCRSCFLHCVLERKHAGEHMCGGDHRCHALCSFCQQEDAGQRLLCRDKAGHAGHHVCGVKTHLCGKTCGLADVARNCSKDCGLEKGHEGDHRCSSKQHMCKAECSLPGCGNRCVMPYELEHSQHACHEKMCPEGCQVAGCTRTCDVKDHFHVLTGSATHFCGSEHPCKAKCEMAGYCGVTTEVVKTTSTFKGKRGEFEYELVSEQRAVRKDCCVPIPPHSLSHSGPHCHSQDPNVVHFCEERCGGCEYVCTLPEGHSGAHDTTHGNMRSKRFSSEAEEIDLGSRKYVWGESGVAEMCNLHCKARGRGHVHLIECEGGKRGGTCIAAGVVQGGRHETMQYGPDYDVAKDELTHDAYWRHMNFKDPCTEEERVEFALCGHFCPDNSHSSASSLSNALSAAHQSPSSSSSSSFHRSYCQEKLWHGPVPRLSGSHCQSGFVSQDGHHFPCSHAASAAHHVVFVVDHSGSMGSPDMRPTIPAFQATHDNRLGAVLQAMSQFIDLRLSMQVPGDKMSLVFFDDSAYVAFSFQDLRPDLMNHALTVHEGGGTQFQMGLRSAAQVIQAHAGAGMPTVIMFLSDGEDWGHWNAQAEIQALRSGHPRLKLHSTVFGDAGPRCRELLERMAEWGGGQFTVSLDEIQLNENFRALAMSLKDATAALL